MSVVVYASYAVMVYLSCWHWVDLTPPPTALLYSRLARPSAIYPFFVLRACHYAVDQPKEFLCETVLDGKSTAQFREAVSEKAVDVDMDIFGYCLSVLLYVCMYTHIYAIAVS